MWIKSLIWHCLPYILYINNNLIHSFLITYPLFSYSRLSCLLVHIPFHKDAHSGSSFKMWKYRENNVDMDALWIICSKVCWIFDYKPRHTTNSKEANGWGIRMLDPLLVTNVSSPILRHILVPRKIVLRELGRAVKDRQLFTWSPPLQDKEIRPPCGWRS